MNQQVAQAFKKLFFSKRTGVLTCEAASARRAVFFNSGFVVGAQSSRNEDRLGEVMMRHGRITKQQFEDASHFIKSGWKLGEILAELKVIEEGEIQPFVRLQLLDIACMQLISPPKRLAFSPLSDVESSVEAPLSVADILMEAARRTPSIDKELAALREEKRRLGFPKDAMKRFQDVNLKPEEAFVLSRVDGTQTPNDIFAVSPLSEEQTARTLIGLLQAEVIEPEGLAAGRAEQAEPGREKKPPSRATKRPSPEEERERERAEVERLYQEFQFQNHWEVLELAQGATAEEVKAAFVRRAKRFHPDRFRRFPEAEFQEKLSYVFRRINEAHETLSSDARGDYEKLAEKESQYAESRQQSVPGVSRVRRGGNGAAAQELFVRAQMAYDQGDFWQAIQLCQQAIDVAPERAEQYHLLGRALSRNPKWRQDAEKNFRIATNLDPWKAEYQLELARLYDSAGLHLRARKAYEKARVIDPAVEIPGD